MRIIQPSRRPRNGQTNVEATVVSKQSGKTRSKSTGSRAQQNEDLFEENPNSSARAIPNTVESRSEVDGLDELPPGKKRRRSELATQTNDQPLELVVDPAKKEFNQLLASGVRLLAMREHSVKEMVDKLSAKGSSSDQVHAVIDDLLENKYLSDDRFTEAYVRTRANRGFGPIKIRAELKAKGISSHLIQDHLNPSASIWFDNAESQYQKKYGDTALKDYNTWTKRARFMQSRGFTTEHIQVALPQIEFD